MLLYGCSFGGGGTCSGSCCVIGDVSCGGNNSSGASVGNADTRPPYNICVFAGGSSGIGGAGGSGDVGTCGSCSSSGGGI